jgi:hypothetical protein
MVIYNSHAQRSVPIPPVPVGVFEDDLLLLRLAARSRPLESAGPRAAGPINADDLALRDGALVGYETWEL